MPNPSVQIGDQTVELHEFSGFKAIEVSASVSEITTHVPELYEAAAAFRKRYIEQSTTEVDRATAELQYGDRAKQISEEAWQAAGNVLKLDDEPSGQEVAIAIFHLAFRKARKHVVDVLALLLTPNSVFEEADDGTGNVDVDDAIKDARRKILHKATAPQLVSLAATCADHLQSQFDPVRDDLGKLGRLLGATAPQESSKDKSSSSGKQKASTSKTGRGGGRGSSSGSPKRQGGRGGKSSTASRGSSSSSSVPA